ncbi:MAG: protein kinase domain-containing protein [Planctomycetota bacterium]|jgi:serine/threonine-protein kinase
MDVLSVDRTWPEPPAEGGDAGWALVPGREIGGYRVVKPLGRGGMGEVYLVENVQMEMPYALKLLPEGLASDTGFRERFRREARLMAELDHAGIVRVLHMAEEDGRYFLNYGLRRRTRRRGAHARRGPPRPQ